MARILLDLPEDVHDAILSHLLPEEPATEEAAFVFAREHTEGNDRVFQFVEWFPVRPEAFEVNSPYYLELADETRAKVIKRAHDLGASIVEFHSHLGPWRASFSESDRAGFEDFVPHVWWRLRGRPYLAVVVTSSGFDALIWITDPRLPEPLTAIRSGRKLLQPTRLTLRKWSEMNYE